MGNQHTIVKQKAYWDKLATNKVFTHPLDLDKIRIIITPEKRILDYGCGYGRLGQQLWESGYKNIKGVDISPKMIERGKQLYPYLDLEILEVDGKLASTPSFNLVLLFSVLTCLQTDDAIQTLINSIHSILKPGGYLYISDTLIQTNRRNVKRYELYQQEFDKYGVFRLPDGGIFRHFKLTEVQEFTWKFEQISSEILRIKTMNNHPARGFQYLCRKAH